MDRQTLKKANELDEEIKQCQKVLDIFEHHYQDDPSQPVDTKPVLIIEHLDLDEYEGRAVTRVPGSLSKNIIELIARHVKSIKEGNEGLLKQL